MLNSNKALIQHGATSVTWPSAEPPTNQPRFAPVRHLHRWWPMPSCLTSRA